MFSMLGIGLLASICYLAWPTSCFFNYNLIVPSCFKSPISLKVFVAVELPLLLGIIVVDIFVQFYSFYYLVHINFWVSEVCKKQKAVRGLSEQELYRLYNSIILMSNSYNQTVFILVPIYKFFNFVLVVIGFYGSIRFHGKMDRISYSFFPNFTFSGCLHFFVFSKFTGNLFNVSQKFCEQIRNRSRGRKRLQAVSIRIGNFYSMKRVTEVTALSIVINATVSLLLAYT
jgi:hypothetical protein